MNEAKNEAERGALSLAFMRLPGAVQSEGSGLSLAIIARLVVLMGGTIGVKSDARRGSLFWVELPLPATAVGEEVVSGPSPMLPLGQPLRRLLANDVLVNREVARVLLNGAGHAVEVVAAGSEAVDAS